jgi:hypothetical protein
MEQAFSPFTLGLSKLETHAVTAEPFRVAPPEVTVYLNAN